MALKSRIARKRSNPIKKLNNEELQLVLDLSKRNKKTNPTYRKGQLFINALKTLFPETADSITATFFDPYYDDKLLDSCIKYLSD